MVFAINSVFLLWGIILVTAVLFFWSMLRFALSTCDADSMTRGLARLFCLILLLAGLALGVMLYNLPL